MRRVICIDSRGPGAGSGRCAAVVAVTDHVWDDIRIEKILDIKRQLMEGRYSLADKLDVVVDRLLDSLL